MLEVNAPRSVIATACKAKVVSESDAKMLLEMLHSRNYTLQPYKEEVAEQLSAQIPEYYKIMNKYIEVL